MHLQFSSWWALTLSLITAMTPPVIAITTVAAWFVRHTVKHSILEANLEQLKELQKMYIPSMDSRITGREIDNMLLSNKTDLEKLKADFTRLELYAHTKVHDINNLLSLKVAAEYQAQKQAEGKTGV